ncbi:DUF1707 and DUF4870 domain-containing protein [Thermobifida cellulosilytica]|uniref:DUF1707 domain-containing protein n=1 Tax=Thermobifida cellulosilytica TB100 TaxID=665004 RepID=A0A147KEF6_THECS|nr:DUF1707 and DUF4870 domain-containing protein [Thermobifida cellulosilytica]KUP95682.1 hypothetical protein AC529_16170 [Thermobifida cellulosilytica TB100]
MRVTHAERDRVAEVLQNAYAEGQLDEEELDERLGKAMAAKTRGELQPLVADLSISRASAAPFAAVPEEPSKDERLWAAGGHLSGYLLPALGPLIVLAARGNSPYVRAQAYQALNYHLNLIIATLVFPVAALLLVTIPVYLFMILGAVVLPLIAGGVALVGSDWKYPFTVQIIKDRQAIQQ